MKREFIACYKQDEVQAALVTAFPNNPTGVLDLSTLSESQLSTLNQVLDEEWFAQRRHKVENDYGVRHPIAYGVVVTLGATPKVFVYQRTQVTGEGRLAGKMSIGVGGHVDIEDIAIADDRLTDIIDDAFIRELHEEFEVLYDHDIVANLEGKALGCKFLINSWRGVDAHHLGFVPLYVCNETNEYGREGTIISKEGSQVAFGFKSKQEIMSDGTYEQLESWSQLLIDRVFDLLYKL